MIGLLNTATRTIQDLDKPWCGDTLLLVFDGDIPKILHWVTVNVENFYHAEAYHSDHIGDRTYVDLELATGDFVMDRYQNVRRCRRNPTPTFH